VPAGHDIKAVPGVNAWRSLIKGAATKLPILNCGLLPTSKPNMWDLKLSAKIGACLLKFEHPAVEFLSGFRALPDDVDAVAGRITEKGCGYLDAFNDGSQFADRSPDWHTNESIADRQEAGRRVLSRLKTACDVQFANGAAAVKSALMGVILPESASGFVFGDHETGLAFDVNFGPLLKDPYTASCAGRYGCSGINLGPPSTAEGTKVKERMCTLPKHTQVFFCEAGALSWHESFHP
jgi:hypothetical protein